LFLHPRQLINIVVCITLPPHLGIHIQLLPIQEILSALTLQLEAGNAIVVAPPGAGKSTSLPLFLLRQLRFQHSKIIMLQPRRIAARTIAYYLSEKLGEKVGNTVGYRVRGENQTSANTRLEIVTEGILTRMLQATPELPGVGLIIFDEFHERSIHADFSLALSLEVQQALRDDLRILVMSATLNAQAISKIMPDAKLLESKGRSYPVDIKYVATHTKIPIVDRVCELIIQTLENHDKDFLVFLPGAYEIKKATEILSRKLDDCVVLPLFSDLNKEHQQEALMPNKEGKRKIVLATNIAETSLTIEGIEVVIDSGIEKKAIFDLRRGITQLTTQKISQASATQRAGRAGRVMAGTCYRLWSKELHGRLAQQSTPEILQSDVSDLVLEAAIWGAPMADLALIDQPNPAQLAQGEDKLVSLGIIDQSNKVSKFGRQVHALGGNVNIAIMLLKSIKLSRAHQSLACALAALLESKDPLTQAQTAEVTPRLTFLLKNKQHNIWLLIKQWHRKQNIQLVEWPLQDLALILAFGFPQWIAKYRSEDRFSLANGSGATLGINDDLLRQFGAQSLPAKNQRWLAIGHMQLTDKQQDSALIRYAEPISFSNLQTHFSPFFNEKEIVQWDEEKQRISATESQLFGRISFATKTLPKPSPASLIEVWKQLIQKKGIHFLPFDERSLQLIKRVDLLRSTINKAEQSHPFPDFSELGLLHTIEQWLLPFLANKSTWQAISKLDYYQLLSQKMDYKQLKQLDSLLPEGLAIPTGRKVGIHYNEEGKAFLSVKMQELYGMQQHPTLLNGKLPITCELLSPAQRPLQTTDDLIGFWQGSYRQIQKEMKGRYPRHFWPDDPANSPATATIKKRMPK
jgi:ATP-dependent helicase HrpB